MKRFLTILVVLAVLTAGSALCLAAESIPTFESPILVTCTGQTPESLTFSTVLKKVKIEAAHDPLIVPNKMSGYKTMFVAMGASLKGLGAAGLNQNEEMERCNVVFAKAKELGIKIVGVHIGGLARRNAIADKFITPFAVQCDYLLVLSESNQDGLFTKISADNNIPLTEVANFTELPPIVAEMF